MFDSESYRTPTTSELSTPKIAVMSARIVEVADGIYALRYAFFDQTIGLVVGDGACLVIDTRTTYEQARELQQDIRRITSHPWIVLNTHHHFDHTFGNAVFRAAQMWGHERCARTLLEDGEEMRRRVALELPELAKDLESVEIVPPTTTFADATTIHVGTRPVDVRYLGRGHTDNDVVAVVPDESVVFAGDLVEQGAPPSFGDSFPLEWPETDQRLLAFASGPVVPGHGEVVDASFVRAQAAEIAEGARRSSDAFIAGVPPHVACRDLPYSEPTARDLVERTYAQLRGEG